jgi:tagatose 1,6-diphosphate aldolase GatY/KbaY
MISAFAELLAEGRERGRALGAFTCYDLETASGVLAAAAECDAGVLLLVSSAAFAHSGGDQLVAALRAAAERSPARACVQLDHVSDLDLIERAFEAGCGAAMADGSKLALEDNAALVVEAVGIARFFGGAVEAELGHVSGEEDVARAAAAGKLTDPDEVGPFIARTGAACLAVSIGNVHGTYSSTPALDWPRLTAIRAATELPLSLHGASGLPDEAVRRAVAAGIAKVNVNTELREAYLDATAGALPGVRDGGDVLALHRDQTAAAQALAASRLRQYEREAP